MIAYKSGQHVRLSCRARTEEKRMFLQVRADAVRQWLARQAVIERVEALSRAHQGWVARHNADDHPPFPGGAYVLLHTLSHLLVQSLGIRSGVRYQIRERVHVDPEAGRFGILLDADTSGAAARYVDLPVARSTSKL